MSHLCLPLVSSMFTLITLLFLSLFYSLFLNLTRPTFPVSDFIFGNVYFPFGFTQHPLYLVFSCVIAQLCQIFFLLLLSKIFVYWFRDILFPILFLSWVFFCCYLFILNLLLPVLFLSYLFTSLKPWLYRRLKGAFIFWLKMT